MSGEYYCTGDDDNKHYPEYDPRPSGQKTIRSDGGNLLEMETQIEMAEYRCNTLKDQLDLMKETYGLKQQTKTRKISNISAEKKAIDDLDESSASSLDLGKGKEKPAFPKKQVSNAISTDNSGAAVRTINNILNGITNSVNRLSELQVQMSDSPRKSFGSKVSPHLMVNLVDFQENQSKPVKDLRMEIQNPDSAIKVSTKSKNIKRKLKELKSQPIRRTVKNERRIKTSSSARGSSLIPGSNSMVSRAKLNNPSFPTKKPSGKIVELYHNLAAKNSDSDEGTVMKSENDTSDKKIEMCPIKETSTLTSVPEERYAREYLVKPQETRQRMFRNVQVTYDRPDMAANTISYYSKNYQLPTIASRMKQAAKCYLGPFSFKTIPFCAAISTSPSHNIGINIQQVMSILKTKQPLNGISPTLAHNIEMAAHQLNSRPLSTLLTSINSRMSYKPSQCPLSKSVLNYQQLQEMAKSIPEEAPEDLNDKVESPKVKTIVVTGPSGDVEVKASASPVWGAESTQVDQCTCIQPTGVDLQQIVNKYKRPVTSMYTSTVPMQKSRILPRTGRKCSRNELKHKTPASESRAQTPLDHPTADNPLCGKEKNLREVLMNLHDEFEFLNKRYEDLSQGGTGDDAGTLKELEELENALNKKEEEITMVMTLYKEVLELKQQIKALKEKTSQASVQKRESREENNFKDYTHPKAALHLTKLLRQIQMYQMKYKKSGGEM